MHGNKKILKHFCCPWPILPHVSGLHPGQLFPGHMSVLCKMCKGRRLKGVKTGNAPGEQARRILGLSSENPAPERCHIWKVGPAWSLPPKSDRSRIKKCLSQVRDKRGQQLILDLLQPSHSPERHFKMFMCSLFFYYKGQGRGLALWHISLPLWY